MSLEAKTHLDPRADRWGDHDQWTKDREVA